MNFQGSGRGGDERLRWRLCARDEDGAYMCRRNGTACACARPGFLDAAFEVPVFWAVVAKKTQAP